MECIKKQIKIIEMKKIFYFLLIVMIVSFISSCVKEEKGLVNDKELNLRNREKEDTIFYNNLVPQEIAKIIAENINFIVPIELRIGTGEKTIENIFPINDSLGITAFYIINFQNNGFVVISADERYEPICAVVEEGKYQSMEVPSGLLSWFDVTLDNIDKIRYRFNLVSCPPRIRWKEILEIVEPKIIDQDRCCPECPNYPECLTDLRIGCGDPRIKCNEDEDPCGENTTTVRGPYLTTRWGQRCTFNEQCPEMNCDACWSNDRALTGCVATSIAQVLRYWAHPELHHYNYSSMPNTFGNTEVQRMMRDAGDEVDMNYGCEGSDAKSGKVPEAFKDGFDFSSCDRDNYSPSSFLTVISNLNSSMPVILDGCRTRTKWLGLFYTYSNCHSWVCDGYERTGNRCYASLRFHMNWGHDGSGDGWFTEGNWTSTLGTYLFDLDFCYNIHP